MPKISSAGMTGAHSAITAFLGYLNIPFSTDYTCDASRNTTGLYAYGTVSENSFAYKIYGKPYWYVASTGISQTFAYCDNIYFYDSYDQYGNFKGRAVSISGSITVFSCSLPSDIIYSYNAGGLGFYVSRFIINDYNSIFIIKDVGLAGSGYYDGGSILVTQKLRLTNWFNIIDLDAYWGSLNNYEVVQIGNSYYFKILNYNALFPGDGTEGTVKTPNVVVVPEETVSIRYLSVSEIYEEGFILSLPKMFKVNIELV
jgi:hypothetical protein